MMWGNRAADLELVSKERKGCGVKLKTQRPNFKTITTPPKKDKRVWV